MEKINDAEVLESTPTLTFEPFEETELETEEKQEELLPQIKEMTEIQLTEEEKRMVQDFSEKIDLKNSSLISAIALGI